MKLTRRDMLKVSGSAAVALAACGDQELRSTRADDTSQVPTGEVAKSTTNGKIRDLVEGDAFPLGISSGDVQQDRATLWTRYVGSDPVTVHVWEEDDLFERVVREQRVSLAESYGHTTITGLDAGKRYLYAFSAGNKRSQIGRFRAAIDSESLEPVAFLGYSCTHYRREPYPALSYAALEPDIDFWVCGGDKVYCDQLEGLQDAYRASYERTWRTAGYRALHAAASTYGTWDDHEFENNFNPEKTDPAVTALAKHSFFEHHPFERPADDHVWRSVRWGKTLELFILDCRSERRPSQDIYISQEQMDWLKKGLAESPCTFKFIVNSVPIADMPLVFDVKAWDRWTGYDAQREEILSHIKDNGVSDVWWLSGDFHFGCVGKVQKNGPYSDQKEVCWGPGGQRANPLHFMLDPPQWDFATGDSNYMVFRCDPLKRTVALTVVNDRGQTLFEKTYGSN